MPTLDARGASAVLAALSHDFDLNTEFSASDVLAAINPELLGQFGVALQRDLSAPRYTRHLEPAAIGKWLNDIAGEPFHVDGRLLVLRAWRYGGRSKNTNRYWIEVATPMAGENRAA